MWARNLVTGAVEGTLGCHSLGVACRDLGRVPSLERDIRTCGHSDGRSLIVKDPGRGIGGSWGCVGGYVQKGKVVVRVQEGWAELVSKELAQSLMKRMPEPHKVPNLKYKISRKIK